VIFLRAMRSVQPEHIHTGLQQVPDCLRSV
jgi:hypothetical protein